MKKLGKKTIALLLSGSMLLGSAATSMTAVPVRADEQDKTEAKYISDVFIAYGKTETEAIKWLTDNGWEPIRGNCDFNAGKASQEGENVAAVMGIKRTADSKEAITDMAVMNMHGAYDFPGYEELVNAKNEEINEFIDSFLPAIEEYRENYNGEEGTPGYERAHMANELMNKFTDGGDKEKYPGNDTGKEIGDMLLEDLVQEGNADGGDLRQIILESSTAAVLAIESAVAAAADTDEQTWLDRLSNVTLDYLKEHVGDFCPDAQGVDVAPSAAMHYYMLSYGDAADNIADQWDDIHEKMIWFEKIRDENGLLRQEDESDEEYSEREWEIFSKLKAEESTESGEDIAPKYNDLRVLHDGLYMIPYEGEWGETLGDFFNPQGDNSYAEDSETYLPMAVALSEGQRRSLGILSLYKLLMIGLSTDEALDEVSEEVDKLAGDGKSVSVYTGINRGIFRGGVALTSETLQRVQQGVDPYDWGYKDLMNVIYISEVIGFAVCMAAAAGIWRRAIHVAYESGYYRLEDSLGMARYERNQRVAEIVGLREARAEDLYDAREIDREIREIRNEIKGDTANINSLRGEIQELDAEIGYSSKIIAAKVFLCVGVIILAAGIVTAYIDACQQQKAYYNKSFTRIPNMIVDEADIVSYVKDENGQQKRCIEFEQFAYYDAVRCNRSAVGQLSKWQSGVDQYASLGCGDLADLNCDHGLEWLALYTAKNREKGKPILADSLKLVYGNKLSPASAPNSESTLCKLHYFNGMGGVNLADRAYCYNNAEDKTEMCFYWNVDDTVKNAA